MVMAVLSSQVFIHDVNCEFKVFVVLQTFMNQHLVFMFPTCFFVDANGSANADAHCSHLSPFEPAASFNSVCLLVVAEFCKWQQGWSFCNNVQLTSKINFHSVSLQADWPDVYGILMRPLVFLCPAKAFGCSSQQRLVLLFLSKDDFTWMTAAASFEKG